MTDLLFVDTETTGLDPFECEVVEFAWCRTSDFDLENGRFKKDQIGVVRVMPERPELAFRSALGKPSAADINGFSVERWQAEQARIPLYTWPQAMAVLYPMIQGSKWCGANAQFDYRFYESLNHYHHVKQPRLGDYHLVDISTFGHLMVNMELIAKPSLDDMASYFGIGRSKEHHSSNEDVWLTIMVYHLFQQKMKNLQEFVNLSNG